MAPSSSGSAILVDPGGVFPLSAPPPGGTLLSGEEGPTSCPGVLVLMAAVPLLAVGDPMVTPSPVEGIVGDCDVVTDENITLLLGPLPW